MLIVALVVVVTSISNPKDSPNVSIPIMYENMEQCQNQLDKIKTSINALEFSDESNSRSLKMYNRQIHEEGIIYWFCKERKK